MKVAIAMAHGHTAKWLQTVIHSLKENPNHIDSDIYVACTWPGHPSIRALTETELGEGVTLIDCNRLRRLHSHATGLEEILEHIADKGYDYMFTCETDCRAVKPGWLDWFVSFMEDVNRPTFALPMGLAGFFWHEGTNHYNINPSGTIYSMEMLLQYHKEARENNEDIFWHPKGNRMGTDGGMDPTIKDLVGVFAETRGIQNPTPFQYEVITKGVPQASWFEPGQWLYARLQGEWDEKHVPCEHIYVQYPGHMAPEATYYGGKADPWFIHYWGGTRCYDFLKHPISDNFVKSCAPVWIKREDVIWRETVPEKYRSVVHQINKDIDIGAQMEKNLGLVVPEVW